MDGVEWFVSLLLVRIPRLRTMRGCRGGGEVVALRRRDLSLITGPISPRAGKKAKENVVCEGLGGGGGRRHHTSSELGRPSEPTQKDIAWPRLS